MPAAVNAPGEAAASAAAEDAEAAALADGAGACADAQQEVHAPQQQGAGAPQQQQAQHHPEREAQHQAMPDAKQHAAHHAEHGVLYNAEQHAAQQVVQQRAEEGADCNEEHNAQQANVPEDAAAPARGDAAIAAGAGAEACAAEDAVVPRGASRSDGWEVKGPVVLETIPEGDEPMSGDEQSASHATSDTGESSSGRSQDADSNSGGIDIDIDDESAPEAAQARAPGACSTDDAVGELAICKHDMQCTSREDVVEQADALPAHMQPLPGLMGSDAQQRASSYGAELATDSDMTVPAPSGAHMRTHAAGAGFHVGTTPCKRLLNEIANDGVCEDLTVR